MSQEIFVYVDLQGIPHKVGRLWMRSTQGRESASFEYDPEWLAHGERFALEPLLSLGQGAHHSQPGHAVFGSMGDSAPDRWGRMLIRRNERRKARQEERTPRTLTEADYLLAVGDFTRQGALRFSTEENGPFLTPQEQQSIPPLVRLGDLLHAAMRISADEEEDNDLQLLLAPGSSLGGARAKASVLDQHDRLAIAKFPQSDDEWPVTKWEAVALTLAGEAGIAVPEWRLEAVLDRQVLILQRFDRSGPERIPFLSAMSMLGARDNEIHSYLELLDALRRYGSNPARDSEALWRRIVFNILISNTDDHLRNHGFLYREHGWELSPAYDMNPMPVDVKPRILSLAIDEADQTASLELALDTASEFGISPERAKAIAHEVGTAVTGWRHHAKRLGLSKKECERMASAFEHDDLKQACQTT